MLGIRFQQQGGHSSSSISTYLCWAFSYICLMLYIIYLHIICGGFRPTTRDANVFSEGPVFSSFVGLLRNLFLGIFHQ